MVIARLSAIGVLACASACSPGNRYDQEARTASVFAHAVAQHDTVTMRRLSTPIAGSRMAMALREIPRAYVDFGDDLPGVVRTGNPRSTDFFVASRALRSCHGGLVISITPGGPTRVSAIRLKPDASDAQVDPCRGQSS